MITKLKTLKGVVLDEKFELTIQDMSRACSVRQARIMALIEEGIITPSRRDRTDYRFSGHSLRRAIKALRLQRDLNLNLAGVALALDLLDENRMLRERLRLYEK